MKLLYTNFHDGDGGGHTSYVMALARAFAGRHEVHVAVPATSRLLREASALPGVHAVAQEFPNGLKKLTARSRACRSLARMLRSQRFDVVHVNGSADHRLVLAAMRGLHEPPRVVLTKHNSKPVRGLGHAWRSRRTDHVIAVCDYTLRDLQRSPYRHCRLATVHNGIDIGHYAPWPAEAMAAERERWAHGAPLLVGSVAGTAPYKGWMDLVEALALLPEAQRAQVRVLIAGKPPSAEQRRRVDELGLAGQVNFPGILADVRPMIAAIDVGFVLSYQVETISFACREMMAMGKPVLVSDYAGLPENIDSGHSGWLVPVRDRTAIANTLRTILQRREHLAGMGSAARARAEAEFGMAHFVERTEAVYRQLLA